MIYFNDDFGLFGCFFGQDMSECDLQVLCELYDVFKVVVDCFLKSKYVFDVVVWMCYIVNVFVLYEVYVVDYYYCCGVYVVVINCVQFVIKDYKGVLVIEDVLYIMILLYGKLNQLEFVEDIKCVFVGMFFDSLYVMGYLCFGVKKLWWQF